MKKEIKEDIIIKGRLDVQITTYLTRVLLQKLAREEIEFDLKVRKGSIEAEFIIGFLSGYSSSLSANITMELIKSIWRRLRKEIKQEAREPEPITIISRNLEEIITGRESMEEINEKFRRFSIRYD